MTRQYAEAVCTVADELDVPVVDMWSACMRHAGWKPGEPLPGSEDVEPNERLNELFTDGLHLTPKGYQILYDEYKAVIRKNWPELLPENLEMRLPPWDNFPDNWNGPTP